MNNDASRPLQVGDRVFCDNHGGVGEIIYANNEIEFYQVGFGFNVCANVEGAKYLRRADKIEPYDRKREFLDRLKNLLTEFDAEIGDRGYYKIEGVEITFGDGEKIEYSHSTINHLNIKDYEKE